MYNRIVLNEPHASIEGLYDSDKSFWNIDHNFVNNVVIKWTDWHTDFLFHGLNDHRISTVRFPLSRFIVDAERLWNDPLERIGQGIVYKRFDKYQRDIAPAHETQLLNLWKWHQRCLANALAEDALLLDCHSFPEEMGDVDICIGFNEDWSKPAKETIDMAVNHFLDHGFSVGVNEPYSNSETPQCNFRYHSLMLEINKRVYLKHGSIELIGGNVNEVIKSFQQRLLMP